MAWRAGSIWSGLCGGGVKKVEEGGANPVADNREVGGGGLRPAILVVDPRWAGDWHSPASRQCALQEHQPKSLRTRVGFHPRVAQDVRGGVSACAACTSLH